MTKPATISDVLKVHDYRYIRHVREKIEMLENLVADLDEDAPAEERNLRIKYDRDSSLSAETWKAALLATGTVMEACDKIMAGHFRNAFCAVRPPGHHAGVFGKTFKNNECDQE